MAEPIEFVEVPSNLPHMEHSYCSNPFHLALTFDDGPIAGVTEHIADLLEEQNVPATFYVIGNRVSVNPETLRDLYRRGFQIASHTYNHQPLTQLEEGDFKWDMEEMEKTLAPLMDNQIPTLLRPPQGQMNDAVAAVLENRYGYIVTKWNFDTFDWRVFSNEGTPEDIAASYTAALPEAGTHSMGLVSLQHDVDPKAIETTRRIIEIAREKGYTFVDMATCLGTAPYRPYDLGAREKLPSRVPELSDVPLVEKPTKKPNTSGQTGGAGDEDDEDSESSAFAAKWSAVLGVAAALFLM